MVARVGHAGTQPASEVLNCLQSCTYSISSGHIQIHRIRLVIQTEKIGSKEKYGANYCASGAMKIFNGFDRGKPTKAGWVGNRDFNAFARIRSTQVLQ